MADSTIQLIQQQMRGAFPQVEQRVARYYAMMEYHLGWRDAALEPVEANSGKLLRPLLCLSACRAVGGTVEQALPAAAALQLIHDFSLIHDDIEDDSATRRGRPTVWSIWGLAQGINVGDGMFAVAHLALHRLREAHVPAERVLDTLLLFDQTILTICEGQYLDIDNEGNLHVSEDDYVAMIKRKTAALIGACCELGALVGGADAATRAALRDFGLNLGLAFQVQDDLLGIWGDPERTGKPFAADLYRRKISLPIIHAAAQPEVGFALRERYAAPTVDPGAVSSLLELLDRAGAQKHTAARALAFHTAALAALEQVDGDADAVAALRSMATRLLDRQA